MGEGPIRYTDKHLGWYERVSTNMKGEYVQRITKYKTPEMETPQRELRRIRKD